MAGQKARIDKDSKQYLDKDARPDAEQETAYKTNKELEAKANAGDEPGPVPVNFHGGTKKDRSRRADQVTSGTTGIGDTGNGLDKMESSNPFASVIQRKFSGLSESENPGTASAPATSDAPSLGMYSVNNTDFRQQKIDVRHVLESIALQAAETFEMLDENSSVPDPIINDLQTTAKAVSKIYEYVNKNTMSDTGDPNDTSSVPKETPQGKPGVNEEKEELDEVSKATLGRYINKAKDQIDAASWRSGYNAAKPNDPKSGKVIAAKERQLSKRHGGIELAVDKLTREEVEELDEADRAAPYRKAANAAKREGDMKNYHRNMERFHDHKERVVFSSSDRNKHANQASKHRAAWKSIDEEVEELDEKLIGNQDKIDANKNGKLDAHDFKLLRAKKTMKEAVDLAFAEILRGKLDADN